MLVLPDTVSRAACIVESGCLVRRWRTMAHPLELRHRKPNLMNVVELVVWGGFISC